MKLYCKPEPNSALASRTRASAEHHPSRKLDLSQVESVALSLAIAAP
jgi:hypothetical protein